MPNLPTFSHEELREIWTALQQYADNRDPSEDSDAIEVPAPAASALERLDGYFASFAG